MLQSLALCIYTHHTVRDIFVRRFVAKRSETAGCLQTAERPVRRPQGGGRPGRWRPQSAGAGIAQTRAQTCLCPAQRLYSANGDVAIYSAAAVPRAVTGIQWGLRKRRARVKRLSNVRFLLPWVCGDRPRTTFLKCMHRPLYTPGSSPRPPVFCKWDDFPK